MSILCPSSMIMLSLSRKIRNLSPLYLTSLSKTYLFRASLLPGRSFQNIGILVHIDCLPIAVFIINFRKKGHQLYPHLNVDWANRYQKNRRIGNNLQLGNCTQFKIHFSLQGFSSRSLRIAVIRTVSDSYFGLKQSANNWFLYKY